MPGPTRAGCTDPGTAPSHPLPIPIPSPASGPACAGVAAVPAATPGLPPKAPGPHSSLGSASGGARDSKGGRGGGPGHPSSQPARRPGLREPARWERQGRGGRRRGGRRSSATPVTSGATRLPLLPLPLGSLPPLLLARAKWLWRRYARAGVSRAGENGVHPGRAEAGGPGPPWGGRAPFDRERLEGRACGWAPTNLPRGKTGCPRQPVRPKRLGSPTPPNKGPPADSAWAPSPSGEGMGVGADFSPHYPCSLLLHPTPGKGPRGGRPGARQPSGPPAAVAVVTAPANWPAERA